MLTLANYGFIPSLLAVRTSRRLHIFICAFETWPEPSLAHVRSFHIPELINKRTFCCFKVSSTSSSHIKAATRDQKPCARLSRKIGCGAQIMRKVLYSISNAVMAPPQV